MTDEGEDPAGDRAADGADGNSAGDRDADDGAGNGRAAADDAGDGSADEAPAGEHSGGDAGTDDREAAEAAADEREAVEAPDDHGAAEAASDEPGTEQPDRSDRSADRRPASSSAADEDDGGSFLGNLTSPKKQLGEAAAAFRNARGAGGLPRDEEDRVKLVCRRYAERRAVPLDDLGRPSCFDEDHPDCRGCLEDVRDGTVETW